MIRAATRPRSKRGAPPWEIKGSLLHAECKAGTYNSDDAHQRVEGDRETTATQLFLSNLLLARGLGTAHTLITLQTAAYRSAANTRPRAERLQGDGAEWPAEASHGTAA